MIPKLSIVTVTYNAEEFIGPTLHSVANQTFTNFEHIIVDGKSRDQTLAIAQSFPHVATIICERDKGVYDAMNKGLNLAKGEYILFLNAGDELANTDTLHELSIIAHGNPDVIYGETLIMNPQRKVIGTRTALTSRKLPDQLVMKDFLNGQVVSHQSFIAKINLCQEYNLKYECSADIDWQLNILSKSQVVMKSDSPISKYLQGGISDTQLFRCWKERYFILSNYFGRFTVLLKHFQFAVRFLINGAYKS